MPQRARMGVVLQSVELPVMAGIRHPTPADEVALASLMMQAYVGTVDYEGESDADALDEIHRTLSGEKGPFLWSASNVIERAGALLSAALLVRWQGHPLVSFAITSAAFKGQGLARACMLASMHQLHLQGERDLSLFVTLANVGAISLYESLGFVRQEG